MKTLRTATENEDIILLAVEIEILDAAQALDAASDEDVLRIIERHGPTPAVAGLLLTLFEKRGASAWQKIDLTVRDDLARLMLMVQPQVAVRALGASNLHVVLMATMDSHLHEMIAKALAATLVANSEICLSAMNPKAREVLVCALAERSGREVGTGPDWFAQLTESEGRRAAIAMAFGALVARRQDSFAVLAARFCAEDWSAMLGMAQSRAMELGSGSIELLLAHAPAAEERLAKPDAAEQGDRARARFLPTSIAPTDAGKAGAILAAASTARAGDLAQLAALTRLIGKPTWRREAQTALLRRLLATGARLPGVIAGLAYSDVTTEIVVHKLALGETAILKSRAWARIRTDRRFSLLINAMLNLERGALVPTEVRLTEVTDAVLAMPDAMCGVLALHLVTHLGQLPDMPAATLDRLSGVTGEWQNEILTALARTHALRGNSAKAQNFMRVAQGLSSERLRSNALERLHQLLDYPASVPMEPVSAVVAALATVSGADLPAAMRLCFDRLPANVTEFLVADVIARGRAADAFAGAF